MPESLARPFSCVPQALPNGPPAQLAAAQLLQAVGRVVAQLEQVGLLHLSPGVDPAAKFIVQCAVACRKGDQGPDEKASGNVPTGRLNCQFRSLTAAHASCVHPACCCAPAPSSQLSPPVPTPVCCSGGGARLTATRTVAPPLLLPLPPPLLPPAAMLGARPLLPIAPACWTPAWLGAAAGCAAPAAACPPPAGWCCCWALCCCFLPAPAGRAREQKRHAIRSQLC